MSVFIKLKDIDLQGGVVDESSGNFKELHRKISDIGLIKPITVLQSNGPTPYQLIDGLSRYHSVLKLGATYIKCNIIFTDIEKKIVSLEKEILELRNYIKCHN